MLVRVRNTFIEVVPSKPALKRSASAGGLLQSNVVGTKDDNETLNTSNKFAALWDSRETKDDNETLDTSNKVTAEQLRRDSPGTLDGNETPESRTTFGRLWHSRGQLRRDSTPDMGAGLACGTQNDNETNKFAAKSARPTRESHTQNDQSARRTRRRRLRRDSRGAYTEPAPEWLLNSVNV